MQRFEVAAVVAVVSGESNNEGLLLSGGQLRWDEGEVTDILSSRGIARSAEHHDPRRERDRNIRTSAEEEADDIFESEFTMLKDLWNFDTAPFPVTKQVRASATCYIVVMARLTRNRPIFRVSLMQALNLVNMLS